MGSSLTARPRSGNLYGGSGLLVGTTTIAPMELIAGSTRGFWLRSLRIGITAATASAFFIGRPGANGITPTSTVTLQQLDGLNASDVTLAIGPWGTSPTVPTVFFERLSLPAAVGNEKFVEFYDLWVPPAKSIVVWNPQANAASVCSVVIEQGT